MNRDIDTVKEPLEKKVKADCPSCKQIKVDFTFVGLNKLILESSIKDDLLRKYGNGSLYLYDCDSCSTSMTLASLDIYQ